MPYNASGWHDNTCYFCHQPIPVYEHGGSKIDKGFVPPSPARQPGSNALSPEETVHNQVSQGSNGITLTAREERCCADCYVREFLRVNPGAKPPRMPRLVEDDEIVKPFPKAVGHEFVSSPD